MDTKDSLALDNHQFFSKKTSVVLLGISVFLLVFGTMLVLNSSQFIQVLYDFLSKKVLHREFNIEKWLPTLESFFLFPLLLFFSCNAILFPKYSTKYRLFLLILLLADILFAIVYTTAITTDAHVNSDLAAEYLLAKQCFLEKSILPLGWHYSTEIYILGKHLVSAPMFLFTQNLTVIKTLTSLFCTIILFFSCWYLLSKLEIEQLWIKLLACIMVISPFSGLAWYVLAWGTFYIPHVVFSFFYIGLFLELVRQSAVQNIKKRTVVLFLGLGFLSGLSTIRYIMNFQFPLALVLVILKVIEKETVISDVRKFWLEDKRVYYSVLGLFAGGMGYVFNNVVLQQLYSFSEWNTIAFCKLGTVTFLDIFRAILQNTGFIEGVSVFTPSGIINLLVYVCLLVFVVFIIKVLKVEAQENRKILILFFASSFFFNIFVYLNTEFIPRYLVNILIFIMPCMAILLSSSSLSSYKKYGLGVVWSIVIFTSAFTTMQSQFNRDSNTDKYAVRDFLVSQGYEFGYGTFWNANVFNYLTNGDIEVGNLYKTNNADGIAVITDTYEYDGWLTPKRFYNDDYDNKPIFLILSQAEYEVAEDSPSLKKGEEVYSDDYYKVFEYPSHQAFKESFSDGGF